MTIFIWKEECMAQKTLQIVPLTEAQIPEAGAILQRAFFNDPLCVYTAPRPQVREKLFAWFFTRFVREELPVGGIYTTAGQMEGVTVWLPPESAEPSLEQGGNDGMEQIFGDAYHRFIDTFRFLGLLHQHLVPEPHIYLALLGVAPHTQGQGVGKTLLTPMFQRADREGLACYLETFTPANVPFYEHRGFQVISNGVEPQSQISYWAMRRDPHPVCA